jgi:hypothetical protein
MTLHLLVFGILVIGVVLLARFFPSPSKSLPIEPVVFSDEAGSGGNITGKGNGPGDHRPPVEDITGDKPGKSHDKHDPDDRPNLNPVDLARVKEEFSLEDQRIVVDGPPPMAAFARLDKDVRDLFRDGINDTPGKGLGGTGTGGGKGNGNGTKNGDGSGDGKGTMSQRERRMLRWTMTFTTANGHDYLMQLRDLGAILAIPVGPNHYKIARDLNPPVKFADEDLSKIQRIWWIDENQKSVQGLAAAMQLGGLPPSRVVAFIPPELEKELADKELAFKGLQEDQIFETKFSVDKTGGKYTVRVSEQKAK